MRSCFLLLLFCFCIAQANEFGRKIALKQIPGVTEGAMAAALEGDTLWVGGSDGTLYAFDTSVPDSPRLISKLKVMKNCRQMAVRNGIAALVGRQSGLVLVDIRDSKNPQLMSRHQTIELATGVDIIDNFVYVGNRIFGIESVDISDPAKPRYIGNMLTDEAQSVRAAGNKVFVGDWAAGKILIADAANPAQLRPIGHIQLNGYGDGVDVQGNMLLASTGHHRKSGPEKERHGRGHGVEIWDITSPSAPVRLSRFEFPRFYNIGNDYWTVRISGKYAFCVDTHNGFFVLDISDPRKPVCIGNAQLPPLERQGNPESTALPDPVSSLAVGKGVVYITGLKTGLYIALLPGVAAPPKTPKESTVKAVPAKLPDAPSNYVVYRPGEMIREAAVSGDVAFLAASEGGIRSVRLGERKITELKHYPEHFAFDIKARGDFLYVAENADGIGVYKIGPEGTLTPYARIPMPWNLDCQQIWAPANTDIIIVSDHGGWIFFLDVRDLKHPREILKHNQTGLVYSDLMTHDLVAGHYLFFNWHNSGYAWYEIQGNKVTLANWNRTALTNHRNGSAAFGKLCFTVANNGYYLLGPNQSGSPKDWRLRTVPGKKLIGVPTVDGNVIALSYHRDGEITVLDFSDPEKPEWNRKRSITLQGGMPGTLSFFNKRLVIPGGYSGLYLEKP